MIARMKKIRGTDLYSVSVDGGTIATMLTRREAEGRLALLSEIPLRTIVEKKIREVGPLLALTSRGLVKVETLREKPIDDPKQDESDRDAMASACRLREGTGR